MSSAPTPDRSFLRSARTVSGFTLLSRVLGLARDAATAHLLGAGMVNDALTYAWTVPNAFRCLFGEGALSSAFVPVFTRVLHGQGKARARAVSNSVISALFAFLLLLALALMGLAEALPDAWLARVFGADQLDKAHLTVTYIQVLVPYLAVVCVIAQFMAVLNALGEFAVPATSPVILNLVWLAGVGVAARWGPQWAGEQDVQATQGFVIAGAILLASLIQFAWHLPRLSALGVGFAPRRPRSSPELTQLLAFMGPMLLGMGSSQLSIIADRTIALVALPDGGATHLYYGLRLMQFPLGLVSVALVTTVYPALTRLAVAKDHDAVRATASLALRTNLLIAVTAGVGLFVLAAPIVQVLFQGGHFGAESARLTAGALAGYALGVPCVGSVMLLTRALYALDDVRLPVKVGLASVVVNVVLDLLLVGPLAEFGLALATTLTSLLTASCLYIGLRRRLGLSSDEPLWTGAWSGLALALLMGLAVWVVDGWLAPQLPVGRVGAGLRVAAGMALGLSMVVALAPRMCPQEWRELSSLWGRGHGPEAQG